MAIDVGGTDLRMSFSSNFWGVVKERYVVKKVITKL
jgi:hypothetical protein